MYGDAKGKMSDPIQSKMDPGRKTSSIPQGWILNKRRVASFLCCSGANTPVCSRRSWSFSFLRFQLVMLGGGDNSNSRK